MYGSMSAHDWYRSWLIAHESWAVVLSLLWNSAFSTHDSSWAIFLMLKFEATFPWTGLMKAFMLWLALTKLLMNAHMRDIGKNLSRYVRYRDFYHLPRQTATFLVFCDKPRFFRIERSANNIIWHFTRENSRKEPFTYNISKILLILNSPLLLRQQVFTRKLQLRNKV